MKLLDVNLLVAAHREDAEQHHAIRPWLESQLGNPPGIALSDLVLSGFVRVVTHPKIFKIPTPLEKALEFAIDLRARSAVTIVRPGAGHWEIFLQLCRSADARGNLVPDAYHAALAIEYGFEWITLDRGFARYPGLRWSCPLA
ncbi:MAG: type II toxin-antitoxin system VapC family toxin [Verrucomicrobia bacterium]|nr:type II toxin-antitoxin system VapC family toxin [Verrucomicrobiota bacterium]